LPSRAPTAQGWDIKLALTDWFRGRDVVIAARRKEPASLHPCCWRESHKPEEEPMGFGRGALLWLLGIPLPIILLLALFWR
jgi:hypothetical protein